MSTKRASDMKEAFKRLQVQSPYKLPKSGISFNPPEPSVKPVDDFEGAMVVPTPGLKDWGAGAPPVAPTSGSEDHAEIQPEVEDTSGPIDPWLEKPEVQNTQGVGYQRAKEPEVSATSGAENPKAIQSEVENTSGVHLPKVETTSGSKPPEVTSTSGSPPENRLDRFLPEGRGPVSWREKGSGSLHIPHQLFEFAQKATASRNELLILNCLVRFSLGFRRTFCEAGYSFIAQWTGIEDSANVRKSVKSLLASGLIVKIREADPVKNIAAVYEIPVVALFLEENGHIESPSGGGCKNISRPMVDSTSGQTHRAPHGKNNPQPGVNSTSKKEKKKKTLKKATGPVLPLPEEIVDPEERKKRVADAIQKFELAMTLEAQADYLVDYERTEFPHGFLPPRNVMRNMAALHWVANRNAAENRMAV